MQLKSLSPVRNINFKNRQLKTLNILPEETKHNPYMELSQTILDAFKIQVLCKPMSDRINNKYRMEFEKHGIPFYIFDTLAIQKFDENAYKRFLKLIDSGVGILAASNIALDEAICSMKLEELNSQPNALRDFFNSDEYLEKIKKATQGKGEKYQKQLIEMLNPKTMHYLTKKELLESGMSEEDFINAVKKFSKSTYRLAMDKPNQYLSDIDTEYTTLTEDGHYPELQDDIMKNQQKQIMDFFKENLVKTLRAINYLDVDTVNQMMDRRMEIFQKSLIELNRLNNNNYELLGKLIKCKNAQTLKDLSAKEKIQLCQVLEAYQEAELDTSELEMIAESGKVNPNETRQKIQVSILKNAGVEEEEIGQIPEDKLFNEEYSHLLLNKKPTFANIQEEFGMEVEINADDLKLMTLAEIRRFKNMSPEEKESLLSQERNLLESYKACKDIVSKDMYADIEKMSEKTLKSIELFENIDKYTEEEAVNMLLELTQSTLPLAQEQFLNYKKDDTACLHTVIKESVLGNFDKFIFDESNIYGSKNKATKTAFEESGLDYKEWLKPNIEDVKINAENKQFTIRLWDRNPQEDLFIGNKTSCCTGIGEVNGVYTPVYLANTSFNVVELYDDKTDKAIGMSRVFMGKIDGKNALIMDNIELNSACMKMSEEDEIKVRNGFFEYMNNYAKNVTKDSDAQVYLSSNYTKVPHKDLNMTNKKVSFIGEVSQEKVYINTVPGAINAKEMGNKEIGLYIVPKSNTYVH